MRTQNGHTVLTSIVLTSLAATGCSDTRIVSQREHLVVGYLPIIAHLPAFVIQDENLLKSVDVEYRVFPTSNDLVAALVGGQVDVATTIATAPFMAIALEAIDSGGSPPALIFSQSRTDSTTPFDGVFARPGSGIKLLTDLKGKRVGVFPGSTARNIFSLVLRRDFGVDPSSVKWVMLPPSTQMDALANADIDVLFAYEPTRTAAALVPYTQVFGSIISRAAPSAPYGLSVIRTEYLNSHPAAGHAFIAAFDSAVMVVRESPSKARQALQTHLGLPATVAEKANLEYRLTSLEVRQDVAYDALRRFVEILVEAGELQPRGPFDPKQLSVPRASPKQ